MTQLLGLIIVSFFVTSFLLVPFIDFLFYLRARRITTVKSDVDAHSDTPIHDTLMKKDFFTPTGGGILIIPIVIVLTALAFWYTRRPLRMEVLIIFLTMLTFGALGLVDDLRHIFTTVVGKFKGLPAKIIFSSQIIFAVAIAWIMYTQLGLNNIFIPIVGNVLLGWWYIPLAAFAIVAFSNAYNISDGLDGLSTGLLTICLFALLVLAHAVFDQNLAIFVGIWIGALIAYLYFNVYPARVYLGDAGAFGFGATLAVIGLLTGKILGLAVIGGVYVIIIASSLLQIFSKKVRGKKLFPIAPIHMYFKFIGWEEPKIVLRFWLVGAMFAVFGLWLSLLFK